MAEEYIGENLFSESTRKLATRAGRPALGSTPSYEDQEAHAFLETAAKSFLKYAVVSNARERRYKQEAYVSASVLAQKRFEFDLGQKLRRFYSTDGQNFLPPPDFRQDLGFGVSLDYSDFQPKDGKRRTYTEIVDHMHSKFIDARKTKAPDAKAEVAADLKMRVGKLQANVSAQRYQDARQAHIFANNLNTVIRSYKEALSVEKGFDPTTFSTHLDALVQNTKGVEGLVETGRATDTFRMAVGDLLSVGVTEANYNRDNSIALRYLANTPLRDTRVLKEVIGGLSWKDKVYLNKMRGAIKSQTKFKPYDKIPQDKAQYFEWAMAQVPDKTHADIQERALTGTCAMAHSKYCALS